MLLSFVIPVLNEVDSLRRLVSEIVANCHTHTYEIIFIDDGSRDGSFAVMEELAQSDANIRIVKFRRNFGKAAALQHGFRLARGEVVFTLDADLQDNPVEIPRFLAKLDEGWDLVSGWKQKRHDPLHKVIPSRLFNFVTARAFHLKLKDYNCGFKAYRGELVKELNIYGEMHRYIPALANSLGYRITEIPVEHRQREFGRSKYGLERYLRGFFDLLTVKMVTQYVKSPLYLFGRAGLISALLGTAIMIWMAVLKIFFNQPISNRLPLFLGITLILGGLQFISLGLISELIVNRMSHLQGLPVSIEKTVNISAEESVNPAERLFIERYVSDPKRNLLRFSFLFMILGIVISVGILTAALNLFEGYERALKSVLLDSFAHIRIYSSGVEPLSDSLAASTLSHLSTRPEIRSAVPVLSGNLMAQNGSKARSSLMQAYGGNGKGENIHAKYIQSGSPEVAPGQAVLGHYLAKDLGLALGNTVIVSFPRLDLITPLGMYPNQRALKVSGIYNSGFYEYDRSLIIGNVDDLRALSGIASGFNSIELRLHNKYTDNAQALAAEYDELLDPGVYAAPVINTTLLSMVRMQKWLIFIVFSFLVLIAGINVISGVLTLILDKRNEIAVLKALGAGASTIRNILAYQVTLVCLISVIVGQLFGFLLSWIVVRQNIYKLKGEVYFIDRLELYISPFNQAVIFIVAALLIILCIRIPLRRIDRMRTIDLLRNP